MIDWFVLLAPVLLLPIVLLFVFVGCPIPHAAPTARATPRPTLDLPFIPYLPDEDVEFTYSEENLQTAFLLPEARFRLVVLPNVDKALDVRVTEFRFSVVVERGAGTLPITYRMTLLAPNPPYSGSIAPQPSEPPDAPPLGRLQGINFSPDGLMLEYVAFHPLEGTWTVTGGARGFTGGRAFNTRDVTGPPRVVESDTYMTNRERVFAFVITQNPQDRRTVDIDYYF